MAWNNESYGRPVQLDDISALAEGTLSFGWSLRSIPPTSQFSTQLLIARGMLNAIAVHPSPSFLNRNRI